MRIKPCAWHVFMLALILVGCGGNRSDGNAESNVALGDTSPPNPDAYLVRKGPSPQTWEYEIPPTGVQEVTYPSSVGELMAWLSIPVDASETEPVPALIYVHGGFAFGAGDFEVAQPFIDAGYAVMTPTFRGENGNPGHFELLLGEVDDVARSVEWLAQQPKIDSQRIYLFGHSTGGALASLASLRDLRGVKASGSAAGLYNRDTFDYWSDMVPFDLESERQRNLRLLLPQVRKLQIPHTLYLPSEEFSPKTISQLEALAADNSVPLRAVLLEGDHFSVLGGAIEAFLREVARD